jgi:hypothetical protein
MRNGQMMFGPWMVEGPESKGKDGNLEGHSRSRGEDVDLGDGDGDGDESGDSGSRRQDGGLSHGDGDCNKSGDKNCENTRDAMGCGFDILALDLDGKVERIWVFVEECR